MDEIRNEIQLGEFVVTPNHVHTTVMVCRGDRSLNMAKKR